MKVIDASFKTNKIEIFYLPSFSEMIECAWVQSAATITKSDPLIPKIVSMFTAVSERTV